MISQSIRITTMTTFHPTVMIDGEYIINHPDYSSKLVITVSSNKSGTKFWKAKSSNPGTEDYFKQKMYLGSHDAQLFWYAVDKALSIT